MSLIYQDSMTQDKSNQYVIREAIRKIALGRSYERVGMAANGMSGVGTTRMVHGYVAKIHDDPSDDEFEEYAGTIDVGEYPDETASSEPIIHKGVLLSAGGNSDGGFLIIPSLFSDVTIFMDSGSRFTFVVNFSHADVIHLDAHKKASIRVTETEELNITDDNSPDYDSLEKTGNSTSTDYTATSIVSSVKGGDDTEAKSMMTQDSIVDEIQNAKCTLTAKQISHKVGATEVMLEEGKVALGDATASEPLVLGNELAQLMLDFLTECSKITTPTLMGTMPALNIPNFTSLTTRIEKFLSKTSYTK